ncbi:hypothetical protein HanIR_Chr02g0052611 [Helianthus annuus]|nr:hypothetical protein HanIR_Chr02g0052611 [Helianthus annuus]
MGHVNINPYQFISDDCETVVKLRISLNCMWLDETLHGEIPDLHHHSCPTKHQMFRHTFGRRNTTFAGMGFWAR